MKALEITPTSWILYDDNEVKLGILTKRIAEFTLLTTEGPLVFENLASLEKALGTITFKERVTKEITEIRIADLPVDEEEVFDIVETGEIPSYKKTVTGKTRYAPGHWGIFFSTHYVASFCPKVVTLINNKHIGPFKDRFLLNDEISLANKKLNEQ